MDLKKRILIVEDDPPMMEALTDKLGREGFEVLDARNGEDGLSRSLADKPDLILLDIILPKMDGITMLKKLREDEAGKKIPVIILTNLSDSERVMEATKNGAFDYLVKAEWRLEDVIKKVKARLGM